MRVVGSLGVWRVRGSADWGWGVGGVGGGSLGFFVFLQGDGEVAVVGGQQTVRLRSQKGSFSPTDPNNLLLAH